MYFIILSFTQLYRKDVLCSCFRNSPFVILIGSLEVAEKIRRFFSQNSRSWPEVCDLTCDQSEASGRDLACIPSIFKETRTGGQSSRDLCSRVYPDRVLTRQSPGSMYVLTHSVSLAFFSKHATPHPQLILRSTFLPLDQFLTPSF